MTEGLAEFVGLFESGYDLSPADVGRFFDFVIKETNEDILRRLLLAWHVKGIADSELFELAKIMRERCIRVQTKHQVFVDAVGTGGSKVKTFNVSTAAAFVVAGAGLPVAKHGNRAATSNSGSADVLAELGVDISADAEKAGKSLDEIGMCFLFAPNFHKLSPVLGKVRRELGLPTVFNNLGPLCNPAAAPFQIIGVWDRERLLPTATTLSKLGTGKSWIVHGHDGLDEITLSGPTYVAEVSNGVVSEREISPSNFGVRARAIESLKANSVRESAQMIRDVFDGTHDNAAARDLVLVNAAAALYVAGKANSLETAAAAADESIRSRAAKEKLEQMASISRQV
ncbi:MAG: anthranilate phosphoribosyltransferase [Acidobacteria bacterium]|nr:anthranilate phosphoribosyltransferase [Acidobacteriota bacterium]